jgi:hypothetical protein
MAGETHGSIEKALLLSPNCLLLPIGSRSTYDRAHWIVRLKNLRQTGQDSGVWIAAEGGDEGVKGKARFVIHEQIKELGGNQLGINLGDYRSTELTKCTRRRRPDQRPGIAIWRITDPHGCSWSEE